MIAFTRLGLGEDARMDFSPVPPKTMEVLRSPVEQYPHTDGNKTERGDSLKHRR